MESTSHWNTDIIASCFQQVRFFRGSCPYSLFSVAHKIFLVKIHEGATLTVLLHRLMEHSLVLPETNAIHLCQFPQFYQRFPLTNFTRKIPCLYPWTTIRDDAGVKYLHLIMDRSDACVRTWNGIRSEYVNLPDMCGNAWQIGRDLLVVRDRSKYILHDHFIMFSFFSAVARSFALSTWNPQTSFAMPLPLVCSRLNWCSNANTQLITYAT